MPETRFVDVRRFDSIDSTNRYLMDEARSGAPEGVVAVADHQTAGRGRLGRSWQAPAGANLLLSVLLRPAIDQADRHLATVSVALATLDALAAMDALASPDRPGSPGTPDAPGRDGAADAHDRSTGGGAAFADVGVKWPNDIVTGDDRKLAGILAEADLAPAEAAGTRSSRPPVPPVVVGIGINVNWPVSDGDLPPELRGSAASLRQLTGAPVDREALLRELLVALEPRVAALDSPDGRAGSARDLVRRCRTIGHRVRVELAGDSFEGRARSITPEGHLVVDVDGSLRTVVAGDVVHLRGAP